MFTKVLNLRHTTNTHKKTNDVYQFKQNVKEKKKTKTPRQRATQKGGKIKNGKPQKKKLKEKIE